MKNLVLRDQVHHGRVGAERSQRQSAADRLRQADHVGRDAEVFRRAAPAKLGARLHFVEDQQRAVFGGNVAQPFEEARLRHAQSDVHQDGFENDRRNLAGMLLEAALDGCKIIEGRDDDVGDRLPWARPARREQTSDYECRR